MGRFALHVEATARSESLRPLFPLDSRDTIGCFRLDLEVGSLGVVEVSGEQLNAVSNRENALE